MKSPNSSVLLVILSILSLSLSVSCTTSRPVRINSFLKCLPKHFAAAKIVYTPQDNFYKPLLHARINNLRYGTPEMPKPLAIIAARNATHIQATIICAKEHGLLVKTRSGGHDFEGLSYVSDVPFVMIDMYQMNSIKVNVAKKSVWIQSGALLGRLYYEISQKTNVYGFPSGLCPTVGAGGHFGGGGYGVLMRKYGFSVDNIVDAKLVTANGKILNRKSMGEDLFWAIRGGGVASFGVALEWKLRLVPVPAKVTVFNVKRTIAQGATDLFYKWQIIAAKMPKELFLRAQPKVANTTTGKTVEISFIAHYLGNSDELFALVKARFPKLGLKLSDCIEMSWVESTVFWADFPVGTPTTVLLNSTNPSIYFKGTSDYIINPLPKKVIDAIWTRMIEIEDIFLDTNPYGGRMDEISESATPYPHRSGILFHVMYYTSWTKEGIEATNRYVRLTRKLFEMMTPYVSNNPRRAFQNYKDLDIGANQDNQTNYEIGRLYGTKYFKANFDKLVRVKTMIDPHNFFKNKQSIPTLLKT